MKLHITNLYGQSPYSVALISQNMVAEQAKTLGFNELGVYFFQPDMTQMHELMVRFDGINAAISNDDVVFIQLPTWNGTEFDLAFIQRYKIYSNVKIVLFIHDVPGLMFDTNFYLMERTIEAYNLADVIILPSRQMEERLRQLGLTVQKILYQRIWDHPTNIILSEPSFNKVINFAGSLQRFPFINHWRYHNTLRLFANEGPQDTSLNVAFQGWKFSVELLTALAHNGGFGLVWGQEDTPEYYKMNVSYKLSTYLAAGLPVIVPSSLSNADIIRDNHLGFVVDSLDEANACLDALTAEDYRQLVRTVKEYRELLIGGFTTRKLLLDAIHMVYNN